MDEDFDFVVVGSGGGSMCAGLVMRAQGRRVVIVEKTDKIGGTTATAGGVMWIPNNRFMAPAGVKDSPEEAARYLDSVIGDDEAGQPGASRARRAAYLSQAPRMVDFLVEQGVKLRRVPYWPDYYDEHPGGSEAGRTVVAELFNKRELGLWADKLRANFLQLPVTLDDAMALPSFRRSWKGKFILARMLARQFLARLTGKEWVTAGGALQGRMLQAAVKAAVEFRLDSPVEELIVEGGRVVGVRTLKDGRPWRIGARLGVLLNAGGFARNQEMRDKYIPGTSAKWTSASEGDTGEMILEAERVGAALAQMEARVGNQITLPPNSEAAPFRTGVQMDLAKPHAILVDQTAQRYMNEGGSYSSFCRNMMARNRIAPAVPSWMILDEQFAARYMLFGAMPGSKKPQAWYDQGFLKRAGSLAELSKLCDLDPLALEATVARYNEQVRRGRDEDFGRGDRAYDRWLGDAYHKHHATLGTVEKAPFYAAKVYPGDVGTYGGVLTDDKARVLRPDGSPIEGLYATGVTTASVMGLAYPGAGSSIGPSFTWGYVAAKHAAHADNSVGLLSSATTGPDVEREPRRQPA